MTEQKNKIEALVFDMDGLIFDSEKIVQRSWEEAGDELGIPHMGSHIYHTLGMNRAGRNRYFSEAIGEDFPHEDFNRLTRVYYYAIADREGVPVKPGVRELLTYAKNQGMKLAVASSSSREHAEGHLREERLMQYFDGAVFGDMVHHAKPDPEIYLTACKEIGMEPKYCMALEDAPGGIRSAYAAGLYPVMVPDLVQPTEELMKLIYRKVETLHEVITLLEKM